MDISNVIHGVVAVAIQAVICALIGVSEQGLVAGALGGIMFYAGREVTQAEYHWIGKFGRGCRGNMPWWGGLDYRAWTLDGFMDLFVPVISVLLVCLLYRLQ